MTFCSFVIVGVLSNAEAGRCATPTTPRPASAHASAKTPSVRLSINYCIIIDQHFAERGRFGRLFGAVAHNPRELGLGLDEDTAIIVEGARLRVVGCGCVYFVDGAGLTHSNIAEAQADRALSLYDLRLHVL